MTTKNLRCIISGAVNSKTANNEVLKQSEFLAYQIPNKNLNPENSFQQLQKWGFKTPKFTKIDNLLTADILQDILVDWKNNSNYDIDGLVISKNQFEITPNNTNPKLSMAFKMNLDTQIMSSEVLDVEWNISKDNFIYTCYYCYGSKNRRM